MISLARLEKHTAAQMSYQLKHNLREYGSRITPPKNIDIDLSMSFKNKILSPENHGRTSREIKDYYNHRIKEVYLYKRADVKPCCSWVITAPKDLNDKDLDRFFQVSYEYVCSLYGEENILLASCHYDEGVKDKYGNHIAGRPHMHVLFIPVVKNKKYLTVNKKGIITKQNHFKEKISADALLTKFHLQMWHKNFQNYLNKNGLYCNVNPGNTGKNRTVTELKEMTREELIRKEVEKEYNRKLNEIKIDNDILVDSLIQQNATLSETITSLKEEIKDLRYEIEHTKDHSAWGKQTGWGNKVRSWEHEIK